MKAVNKVRFTSDRATNLCDDSIDRWFEYRVFKNQQGRPLSRVL